jgi:molecular chaperone DnaJ
VNKRDYYEVLGVERNAEADALKASFRKLAVQYHPDRHPHAAEQERKSMEERFKQAAEAYEVLSDPQKRAAYDRYGHEGVAGAAGRSNPMDSGDFSSLFGDLFEGFFGMDLGGSRQGRRGSDLRYDLKLTFEEAAFGKEVTLEIPALRSCGTCGGSGAKPGSKPVVCRQCGGRGQVVYQQAFMRVATPCGQCHGTGKVMEQHCADCRGEGRVRHSKTVRVSIPPGVADGIQVRVRGEGESGRSGGGAGDLYVLIHVEPHSIFGREGDDVVYDLPITFGQAALGTEMEVPTLEGKARLKVPAGTQNGKVFRIKGKGIQSLHGRGRGDQLVSIAVEVPVKLTAKQKELLEEFEKISDAAANPLYRSFLDKVKEVFS